MFFPVVLITWTVMNAYVIWRAATIPFISRHVPKVLLAVLGLLLWMVFPISHFFEDSALGVIGRTLSFTGETWVGILFLLFLALLAVDVVTVFGLFFRKVAPSLRAIALALGATLAFVALIQAARPPIVQDYDIELAGLPANLNGTVVVVASDLHLGALTSARWVNARVSQINALHPDQVVLAGDIVEGHGQTAADLTSSLRQLAAPMGVWAVNGNHEGYGRGGSTADTALANAGVRILRDESVRVRPGLTIAGVNDLTSRRRHGDSPSEFVQRALTPRPVDPVIFVSHTPWFADRAAKLGAGLMISGHTHNGQIWPFTYFVRLSYPMIAGKYEVDGMPLIVCRGTGTWGPPMRLWQRSEIIRITLHPPSRLVRDRR